MQEIALAIGKILERNGIPTAHIDRNVELRTCILTVRERDFSAGEAALKECIALDNAAIEWTLKSRPDTEVLTERGFEQPPPTRDEILRRQGLENYRLENKPNGGYFLAVFQNDKPRAAEAIKECMTLLGDSFMDWELMILPPP